MEFVELKSAHILNTSRSFPHSWRHRVCN